MGTPQPFFLSLQSSHLSAPWHCARNVGDADVKRHHYLTVTHVAPLYPHHHHNGSALPHFTAFRFVPRGSLLYPLHPFPWIKKKKRKESSGGHIKGVHFWLPRSGRTELPARLRECLYLKVGPEIRFAGSPSLARTLMRTLGSTLVRSLAWTLARTLAQTCS